MKRPRPAALIPAALLLLCLCACAGGARSLSPAGSAPPSAEVSPSADVSPSVPASLTPDPAPSLPDTPASVVDLPRDKADPALANAPVPPEQLFIKTTRLGDIQGVRQDGYVEFRGVRYAAAQRWQAPELAAGWDGVYDATAWGDRCCQYYGFYGQCLNRTTQFYMDEAVFSFDAGYSEDCLNLNIFAPENSEGCPVLVYIHGGSFLNGSNTDTSTDGAVYAKNGIVTVSISYRLGPYATAYGDGYTGNLALLDQIAALHWVRDNIADYGGDPAKITVMGESAGAVSVQSLLTSPLVEEGLISGAIMMSGGGYIAGNPTTPAKVQPVWDALKAKEGAESLSELCALSSQELYDSWLAVLDGKPGSATNLVLNGQSLTDDVMAALRGGAVQNVPCIIGVLSEDCYPSSLYNAAVHYGASRAKAGGEPVYLYYFDRVQPGDTAFGAFHAADLYYAFGTLHRNQRPFTDTDYRIARDMIGYFINFIKTGNPNGQGLAPWNAAASDKQQ